MPDRIDWADMVADAVCRRAGCNAERRATVATVVLLAAELAREGREGRRVGTLITIGDTDTVVRRSRTLILDPSPGTIPQPAMSATAGSAKR